MLPNRPRYPDSLAGIIQRQHDLQQSTSELVTRLWRQINIPPQPVIEDRLEMLEIARAAKRADLEIQREEEARQLMFTIKRLGGAIAKVAQQKPPVSDALLRVRALLNR
jgi:hypothetical protein